MIIIIQIDVKKIQFKNILHKKFFEIQFGIGNA